jgi:hypothetical protein
MNTDANHCGELYLGRPSFVGAKGGEGGVGLMENIFYSKLGRGARVWWGSWRIYFIVS